MNRREYVVPPRIRGCSVKLGAPRCHTWLFLRVHAQMGSHTPQLRTAASARGSHRYLHHVGIAGLAYHADRPSSLEARLLLVVRLPTRHVAHRYELRGTVA